MKPEACSIPPLPHSTLAPERRGAASLSKCYGPCYLRCHNSITGLLVCRISGFPSSIQGAGKDLYGLYGLGHLKKQLATKPLRPSGQSLFRVSPPLSEARLVEMMRLLPSCFPASGNSHPMKGCETPTWLSFQRGLKTC